MLVCRAPNWSVINNIYYQVPAPGIPIAWILVTINWKKKTKKKTIKLKELSFLKKIKKLKWQFISNSMFCLILVILNRFYLKALYAGLNQHMKENGVKSIRYRIARPNVENSWSQSIKTNPPITFNSRTHPWTINVIIKRMHIN